MLPVERLDACARRFENRVVFGQHLGRRVGKVAEHGKVNVRIDVAERLHLQVREELRHIPGPIQDRGDDDHRARGGWHALELQARQPSRRDQLADYTLQDLDGQFTGRHDREQGHQHQRGTAPAVGVRVHDRRADEQPCPERDGAEIDGRRTAEEEPTHTFARMGAPRDALLECQTAAADQVIPDVRAAVVGRLRPNLPCPLDRFECQPELRVARRLGQLFHRVPVPVPASEVHAAVHAGGIPLQHLFDEADLLEEFTPVERGDQAQAADEIRHRGLFGGLMAAFGANRIFDRLAACRESGVEITPHHRRHRAVLPGALQQARHESGMHVGREAARRR